MPHLPTFCGYWQLLWASMLTGIALQATAQTTPADTTRLSYGEETVATSSPDSAMRVQREDRSLWKLGLNNFTLSAGRLDPDDYYARHGVHVAYERRLWSPAWSVMGEVSPAAVRYRPEVGSSLKRSLEVRTQLAGRYYYNLERRLRLGHNTTHFSANYVSVALQNQLGARRDYGYAAVLYGLQRRLGRYGFLDFNLGPGTYLTERGLSLILGGSFRIGLALDSWPVAPYRARLVPADEDVALRPRAYAGVHAGAYYYQARYTDFILYPTLFPPGPSSYTTFTRPFNLPYYYAGYYVRPRLAVQMGMQQQSSTSSSGSTDSQGISASNTTKERGLALPVLVRYSLTRSFLQRVQFDAVGGLVPVWSSVRSQQRLFSNGQLTDEYEFRRRDFGLHATGGLNVSYGFGRRRRIQAGGELMLIKPLREDSQNDSDLNIGSSIGLRYRFGYR